MASTSTRAMSLIFFALVICQAASARTLADDPTLSEKIVSALKQVTGLSDQLRVSTERLNYFNPPSEIVLVLQGLANIVDKLTDYNSLIPSPDSANAAPFSDDDAKLIVAALTDFVRVHRAFLTVLIGEPAFAAIATFPQFVNAMDEYLSSLEAVVDTFASKLIALIPTQESAAQTQFRSLKGTVQLAIKTYDGESLTLAPLLEPIRVALVNLEAVVDTFA